ncbi:hypothetical protein LTR53_005464 [Teratosphaeriaceae sp. CCFEE 6253]|nr:hypothetical protein LTR53_005464 [Teratosphaeriaceae sp. CCFEE 6253]
MSDVIPATIATRLIKFRNPLKLLYCDDVALKQATGTTGDETTCIGKLLSASFDFTQQLANVRIGSAGTAGRRGNLLCILARCRLMYGEARRLVAEARSAPPPAFEVHRDPLPAARSE